MLKPNRLRAIEALVAGASDVKAARAAGIGRATLYRWKVEPDFEMRLKHRIYQENVNTKRVMGSFSRTMMDIAMRGAHKLDRIIHDPRSPGWMQVQAVQASMKHAR